MAAVTCTQGSELCRQSPRRLLIEVGFTKRTTTLHGMQNRAEAGSCLRRRVSREAGRRHTKAKG